VEETTLVVQGLVVTIALALLGHAVTIVLTMRQLRETQRSNQRMSWHESSRQLSSDQAAERAVGMAATIDHLHDPQLGKPASRVALDRLLYEDDPLIVYRALQALSDVRLLQPAIEELLVINRHVWRHLLEEFAKLCLDPVASPARDLKTHLEKLARIQRSTSYLLQQGTARQLEGLDFSDTFYPDLEAPGVTFTGCSFRSSLLHYANFHGAVFRRCDFSRCIRIGSYLEAATFDDQCIEEDVVDYTARRHDQRPARDPSLTPPSFLREAEQGWYGHWVEQVGTTRREFEAVWPNPADRSKELTATIVLHEDGRFERTRSDNDGFYDTIPRDRWFVLDRRRGVELVGGTRTLARGVPSVWWAIWWQQLGVRPTQILPIIEAQERQRGS
jgi:hypothetical protein